MDVGLEQENPEREEQQHGAAGHQPPVAHHVALARRPSPEQRQNAPDHEEDQHDEQIDAWMVELMRDMSIRRGVLPVLADFRKATKLDDTGIERVFTAGGGAPATIGRTAEGELMVPAISLHFLVPGLRSQSPKAREQEIDFLVDGFHDVVYI